MILLFLFSILFAREVDFSWEAFEDARGYQIQVASDIEFQNILHKKVTLKPNHSADLPYGQMYYRVRAIDQNKKPGVWSEPGLVVVKPYSPEPLGPESGKKYTKFKKEVNVNFEWKKQKGKVRYGILIKKENGEPILEKEVPSNEFTWPASEYGKFTWQIRSIHNDKHFSDYSSPRSFEIEKRDMGAPLLISPEDETTLPAYRKIKFTWEYFPPSKYTYFEIKKDKTRRFERKEKDYIKLEGLPPGTYQWRVASSEDKDSPKEYSEWREIVTSEEMISDEDHYIGMRLNYNMWDSTYEAGRTGADTGNLRQDDSYLSYEWYANWQVSKHSSFYFSFENAKLDINGQNSLNEMDVHWNWRFGTDDYRQAFVIGLKQKRYLELWQTSGNLNSNLITARSIVLGLKMLGRLPNSGRLHIDLYYMSPTSTQHALGDLNGDQFISKIGYSRKIYKKIWAYYYLGYERNVLKFEHESQGETSWKSESFTPIQLGLEYRH